MSLILRDKPNDTAFGSTYKLDFESCSYKICGDYMIIESKKDNDHIIGDLFELKLIKNYKVWEL